MEDINFASLAPRHGTRPFMGTWNEIGTSQLNGGAFNWSSVWSGLKNFGSTLRTYGNKAWNSSTGQMLREKLADQNFQQKVVDGLASGINGVVDIANQAVQREINSRLDPRPPAATVVEMEDASAHPPPRGEKRPRPDAEETTLQVDEPPSYEEAVKAGMPTTRIIAPAPPKAAPVVQAPPVATAVRRVPARRQAQNWQSTLHSIVGLGVKSLKRRRCY